mgnify:FL=1
MNGGGLVLRRSCGPVSGPAPALSFGGFCAAAPGACANRPGPPAGARPVRRRAPARPFDPWRFRAAFPDLWSDFLRVHYRRPEDVAAAFGVTEKAARNWFEGAGGPQGDKVVVALRLHGAAPVMAAMGVAAGVSPGVPVQARAAA